MQRRTLYGFSPIGFENHKDAANAPPPIRRGAGSPFPIFPSLPKKENGAPEAPGVCEASYGVPLRVLSGPRKLPHHHHGRADADAAVEVDHVMIVHADATV